MIASEQKNTPGNAVHNSCMPIKTERKERQLTNNAYGKEPRKSVLKLRVWAARTNKQINKILSGPKSATKLVEQKAKYS
jgi:hypothetical protein